MYDNFSSVYDKFVNWQNRLAYEMPFIENQMNNLRKEKKTLRILDAACGTGMHVIELAQRGYKSYGADISAPMILKAIENAVTFTTQAEFKAAGFGELYKTFVDKNGGQRFDTLFVLGNSIPHILERSVLDNAFKDMHNCIAPGGFLLIQNRNFDAIMNHKQRWMEPQAYKGQDGEWLFVRFYDFERDGKINFNILTLHRTHSTDWQQNVETIKLFPWQSETLRESLIKAGFTKITWYGDMEGHPFNQLTSGNLIIRADA